MQFVNHIFKGKLQFIDTLTNAISDASAPARDPYEGEGRRHGDGSILGQIPREREIDLGVRGLRA